MDDEDIEDLRHLYFEENEGEQNIQEEPITQGIHLLLLKTKKLNIGAQEKPELTSIGDYWDAETTKAISNLLQEYEDLFLSSIAKLIGIKGDMGGMHVIFKPNARPVMHRPYFLNPRVKEKSG